MKSVSNDFVVLAILKVAYPIWLISDGSLSTYMYL